MPLSLKTDKAGEYRPLQKRVHQFGPTLAPKGCESEVVRTILVQSGRLVDFLTPFGPGFQLLFGRDGFLYNAPLTFRPGRTTVGFHAFYRQGISRNNY
jgi:hypothetical protein